MNEEKFTMDDMKKPEETEKIEKAIEQLKENTKQLKEVLKESIE